MGLRDLLGRRKAAPKVQEAALMPTLAAPVLCKLTREELLDLFLHRQLWEQQSKLLDCVKLAHDHRRANIQLKYKLPPRFSINYDTGEVTVAPENGAQ